MDLQMSENKQDGQVPWARLCELRCLSERAALCAVSCRHLSALRTVAYFDA